MKHSLIDIIYRIIALTLLVVALTGCRENTYLVEQPAFISASTDILDFEERPVGSEEMRTVYLINRGDKPLTLEAPVGDTLGGAFAVVLEDYIIAPNAHVIVRVYFSPYEPVDYETEIFLDNDSVNLRRFTLVLRGRGIAADPCDLVDCTQAPPPACISSESSRIFEPMGQCEDGECNNPYQDELCEYGCNYETGLCRANPCAGLACDSPPTACYFAQGECIDGACQFTPNNDVLCDDANLCTLGDGCIEGTCIGTPVTCDDPPPAVCLNGYLRRSWSSQGACNPFNGVCEYQWTEQHCEFGCTPEGCLGDPCANLTCNAPPSSCYQEVGTCIEGACEYQPSAGSCNDANACTLSDSCQNGTCQGIPITCHAPPVSECTSATTLKVYSATGSCHQGSCTYGASIVTCDDYDACTVSDHCSGGACQAGAPRNCDDQNPCTVDICDPAVGCRHEAATGGACNRGGDCPLGQCVTGSCLAVPDVTCTTEVDVDLCSDVEVAGVCTASGNCVPEEAPPGMTCPGCNGICIQCLFFQYCIEF